MLSALTARFRIQPHACFATSGFGECSSPTRGASPPSCTILSLFSAKTDSEYRHPDDCSWLPSSELRSMRISSGKPPRSTILILFSFVTESDHSAAAAPCCTVSSAERSRSTTGAMPWSCPTLMRCSAEAFFDARPAMVAHTLRAQGPATAPPGARGGKQHAGRQGRQLKSGRHSKVYCYFDSCGGGRGRGLRRGSLWRAARTMRVAPMWAVRLLLLAVTAQVLQAWRAMHPVAVHGSSAWPSSSARVPACGGGCGRVCMARMATTNTSACILYSRFI